MLLIGKYGKALSWTNLIDVCSQKRRPLCQSVC